MNKHHKALASWSLAVKDTENALKRLISISGEGCNNEIYVTTQLENADNYLCKAIEHLRSFANPKDGVLAKRPKGSVSIARATAPCALPPEPPKEPNHYLDSTYPVHDNDCDCTQCRGGSVVCE